MLACVIAAEWIVKDNSQIYKNHHNFPKKHFITISHIKKLKNVVRYVQHVFREHQAIHETCDFFESLFSLVKLFVRYTLFSRASVYCTKLFLTLSEVWCLLVLCLRSCATSKSVLRYTHTHTHTQECTRGADLAAIFVTIGPVAALQQEQERSRNTWGSSE